MNECKFYCKIKQENILECEITKVADFVRLKSININVENLFDVTLYVNNNILWKVKTFEEATQIEIPICEPILLWSATRFEFEFTKPIKHKGDILANFETRFDPVEREKRYIAKNEIVD